VYGTARLPEETMFGAGVGAGGVGRKKHNLAIIFLPVFSFIRERKNMLVLPGALILAACLFQPFYGDVIQQDPDAGATYKHVERNSPEEQRLIQEQAVPEVKGQGEEAFYSTVTFEDESLKTDREGEPQISEEKEEFMQTSLPVQEILTENPIEQMKKDIEQQ
jgi:hypothetical protein